ncbi:MAG: TetR/AcrR family transcriptional regulator [Sulfuricurvum sp.]|uniref:TetR/AcrR family transcriptional regulator n=1 Tax=Sulfuricurvum sp. TaxID=2025608 RepID=UPI00261352FE|nr:TetR/AcrR family transcriptional regulator [Sulfuricurvum sp.]MDD2829924.1 TetR/AcrR family transcriptional regulator [Sulfuricurvum sp.]MDD4949586.1 TetR/AcrR family transcriptional regulator [Sulfuricurvum sp.]
MKENTRQRLIDATYEEVYSHGYQGAALADILANAGVHKGSMYHFFPNKKEMALSAIKEKIAQRFATRYQAIKESDGCYLEQLFAMLRDGNIRDFKRGCPLANLVQEMSNIDEDFDRTLKVIYAQFRKVFKSIYDAAVKEGEMRECDTRQLALFSVALLEGAILSAKASGDSQDYFDSVEMLITYIESYKRANQ